MTEKQARHRRGAPASQGGQFAEKLHGAGPQLAVSSRQSSWNRIPESLLMAPLPDPRQAWELEHAVRGAFDDAGDDYQLGRFSDALPNLPFEEAMGYYETAKNRAFEEDADGTRAIIAEAIEQDLAMHPGGALMEGFEPADSNNVPGYAQGGAVTGNKYTGFRDATEVAADVRKDLKAAQAANYLPKGVTFSVTREKYAGGQSVRLEVRGLSDADRIDPAELDHRGNPAERKEVKDLKQRLELILNAYNRSDVDGGKDYFDVTYYGKVDIETDHGRQFREAEAARARQKKLVNEAKAV